MNLVKNSILGVGVTNEKRKTILEYVLKQIENSGEKFFIVTPNPEIIVFATKHPSFKSILNQAQVGLCDGAGVVWAGKILGKRFKERITGVDFMEALCKEVAKQPITVGFLGGKAGVAETTAKCLARKYPGLKVSFAASELIKKETGLEGKYQVSIPNTDILFVAFGFPKQEEWIYQNLEKIPVRVAMSVGGSFDYISGRVERAPYLVRQLGFEWFYRLIRQPWRIRRQIALIEFILFLIKEKLGSK